MEVAFGAYVLKIKLPAVVSFYLKCSLSFLKYFLNLFEVQRTTKLFVLLLKFYLSYNNIKTLSNQFNSNSGEN